MNTFIERIDELIEKECKKGRYGVVIHPDLFGEEYFPGLQLKLTPGVLEGLKKYYVRNRFSAETDWRHKSIALKW